MSKTHCKENCDFLKTEGTPRCTIYQRLIETDDNGFVRLDKCVQESREYKMKMQIDDIKTYYDVFVCEMDMMFNNLDKLMKGEK